MAGGGLWFHVWLEKLLDRISHKVPPEKVIEDIFFYVGPSAPSFWQRARDLQAKEMKGEENT